MHGFVYPLRMTTPATTTTTVAAAYDQWSVQYDHDRNPTRDLDALVLPRVLGGLRPRATLETGCGTGKNTAFLAGISQSVLAVDFSAGMLAKAAARELPSHVRFTQCDLLQRWPADDGSIDLVSCSLVLEHIEILTPYFREAARVLAPGGQLWVCELHPYKQYAGSQARFTDAAGDTVKVDAFTHHASEFTAAAAGAGLRLQRFDEWWHPDEAAAPPRLISFLFQR